MAKYGRRYRLFGQKVPMKGLGGFDPDYQAVLDYATTEGYTLPSAAQQTLQNQLVLDLKSAGAWGKLDSFSVFATDGDSNFALIDWVRLVTQTAVSSPSFIVNQGYQGDGASSFINTSYTAVSGNYTLNSASHGFYCNSTPNNGAFIGAGNTSPNRFAFTSPQRSGNIQATINDGGTLDFSNTDEIGFYHTNRDSASSRQIYKNGVFLSSDSRASSGLPVSEFYALARSFNGSVSLPSDMVQSINFIGGNLIAEAADFNTAIQTYMAAI